MQEKQSHRKQKLVDKKQTLRQQSHMTRPPRLEGVVKEVMMRSEKKEKKRK